MKKNAMTPAQISKAQHRLVALTRQTTKVGPMMRGTIVTNGKKHRQAYLSLNKNKRTYLIYLGEKRVDVAREMLDNYKTMLEIMEEMTVLNMELLKNDAL